MKITPEGRFRHAEHVSWRRVEGEAVILDLDTSEYYSLNEVGVVAWEGLGEGRSLGEVCASVSRDYEVAPRQAEKDLAALVSDLVTKKLLVPR